MSLRGARTNRREAPPLYRKAWQETSDPLVAEARAQTLALQKLQIWLRLAYSVLALAALLAYWGYAKDGGLVPCVLGAIVGALSLACVYVLRTGIAHGRQNVQAMLVSLEARTGTTSS